MENKKLNVDVPTAISEFESIAKEFELKEKIYKIIFRGKGLEFDSYRYYTPDDDASMIDWKASRRSNKMLVKQFVEERDLEIVFVIDVSENMVLGSQEKLKCEYAAELASALAHLMISSNDKVGFIFFSDDIVKFVPPKRGFNQFYEFSDALADSEVYKGGSNLNNALNFLIDSVSERVEAVFLISDFIRVNKEIERNLLLVGNKFETTAIMVKDPLDKALPDINKEIAIEDPISGQQLLVNPKLAGEMYAKNAQRREDEVRELLRKSNVDLLSLETDKKFAFPLASFLKERVEKKGVIF